MIKLLSARTIAVLVASVASYLLLVATESSVASAAEIKVLSGVAVKPVMSELIPQFERSSGHKVTIDYAPTAPVIVNRIEKGEAVDVAIATQQGIASLVKQGRVTGGSAVDIAKVGVGVMVRKGAPKPDISSVEAFKRTLLAAKSIGHGDPDREGRTAVYVSDLLGRLDIATDIKPKITIVYPPGTRESIAKGGRRNRICINHPNPGPPRRRARGSVAGRDSRLHSVYGRDPCEQQGAERRSGADSISYLARSRSSLEGQRL